VSFLNVLIVLATSIVLWSQMPTTEYCDAGDEGEPSDGELLAIEISQRVWGDK
jgi:hypothetical protein